MKRPTCQTCLYWDAHLPARPEIGTCHRFPPQLESVDDPLRDFPDTGKSDWCGEHSDFPTYIESLRTKASKDEGLLDISGLSVRARKILRKLNLYTRKDFEDFDYFNLMGVRNCGPATKSEIINFVQANNVNIKAGLPDRFVQTGNSQSCPD